MQNQKLLILAGAVCIYTCFQLFWFCSGCMYLALFTVFVIPLSIKGEAGGSVVSLTRRNFEFLYLAGILYGCTLLTVTNPGSLRCMETSANLVDSYRS